MDSLLAKKLQAKERCSTHRRPEVVRKDHDCGRDSGEQGAAGKDRREGAVQAFVGDRQRYGTVR